ncbi:unnamed protein product [Callosobruchus maculatus]|uniref:Uncharacterized protein n=1 Tax=Callosobruchus maculatus TaxID=64391 RepID=A0A653CND8_CALMS|nr:unnamed protein product [Callosobruchus maculatus]
MKAFVVAAVICAVAVLVKAELTEEQKEKLKKHHQECLAETKVDEELVKKARQGDFTEDQKLKDHMFCVLKKTGFLDDAGEIKMDVLKAKVVSVIGEEKAEKIISACAVKKDNGPETAFQMIKCYFAKAGKPII